MVDEDDITYQRGTDRIPAVYILDDDTKVVAVFNKQTGNFVTTCQLTEKEETELKATLFRWRRGLVLVVK
jgi:hypothetical protein